MAARPSDYSGPQFTPDPQLLLAANKKTQESWRQPSLNDPQPGIASKQARKEQAEILKEFRKQGYTGFYASEKVATIPGEGQTIDRIAAMLPELVAQQIANTKSLSYQALRYQQLELQQLVSHQLENNMPPMYSSFDFPVEAKALKSVGPIEEHFVEHERCSSSNGVSNRCSQGFKTWYYLVLVISARNPDRCCPGVPTFRVSIEAIPAVYDQPMIVGQSKRKLLERAQYVVTIDALVAINILQFPKKNAKK